MKKMLPLLSIAFALSGCGMISSASESTANITPSSDHRASQLQAEHNAVREVGGTVITGRTQLMTLKEAGATAPPPLTPESMCYVVYVDLTSGAINNISGAPTTPTQYRYARLVMDASTGLALSYVKSPNPL